MKFMSMMMANAEVMRVVQRFCMYNAKKSETANSYLLETIG